ncbi:MAG: menaquinone-dependent protoporphyrinogen IX dehydrogenase [Gammaproteobacteria bacterium]|nr:menaquinone-dependent protoporphyrinogen IX dehydrogenase [Gammaproteobacteria bacterium]
MKNILILYSTTDGHTRKIAQFLCDRMTEHSAISLVNIEDAANVEIESFDTILIAASIRYGKFNLLLRRFVDAQAGILNKKKTAFLSVNLIARKPEKNSPETNVYTRKFLRKTKWRPDLVCVVAGMLDYPKYNFFDRNIIRFIMKITGGPTDPTSTMEFTDWDKVKEFGDMVDQLLNT